MKIRLYGNSVRVRLSRSEVDRLADGQTVEQRTDLHPQPLRFRIQPIEQLDLEAGILVRFADGEMHITLPLDAIRRWRDGDDPGVESTTGRVNLLIEKDFRCLHDNSQDQADCFPNPLAANP